MSYFLRVACKIQRTGQKRTESNADTFYLVRCSPCLLYFCPCMVAWVLLCVVLQNKSGDANTNQRMLNFTGVLSSSAALYPNVCLSYIITVLLGEAGQCRAIVDVNSVCVCVCACVCVCVCSNGVLPLPPTKKSAKIRNTRNVFLANFMCKSVVKNNHKKLNAFWVQPSCLFS